MKFVKYILGGGILLLLLFATYKVGGKVDAYRKSNELMLVSLYEARVMEIAQ